MTPTIEEAIPRRAWGALFVSTIVVFLVVVNLSSVNVAFPSIREDFGATDRSLSWIVGIYNLVVGSFMLAAGRLADSLGRRKVYLPGVAVFAVGSVLCTLAPGTWWLVAARAVQGFGGSITLAAGFAVMLPEFPASRRSTPIGIAGAAGALGGFVGPLVGSIVIDLISWRAVFALNVPFCVLALVLGPRLLRESRDPDATGDIDWTGVVVGTAAVAALMSAITQSSAWGLDDPRIIGLLAAGLALGTMLIRRCRVVSEPLINLELFKHKAFTSASIGSVFYALAFTSGPLINSLMLQDVWGLSVREVGLVFAVSPVVAVSTSPIAGRLADRVGHRWILAVGCCLCAVSFVLFIIAFGENAEPWRQYVPISLLWGLGVGLTVSTWSSAAIADVPEARFGVAGATYNTMRQSTYGLGIAIAVSLVATVADTATLEGIKRAYGFIAVCFLLAGLVVARTFPAGSARARSAGND